MSLDIFWKFSGRAELFVAPELGLKKLRCLLDGQAKQAMLFSGETLESGCRAASDNLRQAAPHGGAVGRLTRSRPPGRGWPAQYFPARSRKTYCPEGFIPAFEDSMRISEAQRPGLRQAGQMEANARPKGRCHKGREAGPRPPSPPIIESRLTLARCLGAGCRNTGGKAGIPPASLPLAPIFYATWG